MIRVPRTCFAAARLCVILVAAIAGQGHAQPIEQSDPAQPMGGPPDAGMAIALPAALGADDETDRIALTFDSLPGTALPGIEHSPIAFPGQALTPAADTPIGETRLSALWPSRAGYVSKARIRLTGEQDTAEFLLFVDDVRGVEEIVFATQSSAYVFPQRSDITVSIGQTELAHFAPDNISQPGQHAFAVPPGALRPGLNRVRIDATHAHRIFCGAEAAYDLWTEIDLSQSGATIRPDAIGSGAASFLTALGIARGQAAPIQVMSRSDIRVQTLGVLRELGDVVNGEGLSLSLEGTPPDDAASPLIRVETGARARLAFSQTEDGANVMQVVIGPSGLPDLRAAFGADDMETAPPPIALGRKVSLRELGYEDHEVARNLWMGRFDFALPSDWLITTDARAEIGLRLGTSYALPLGAQLRILVNGTSVRMLPLSDRLYESGSVLQIRFPSRLFHGGRNEIAVELVVPGDPADRPCPAISSPKIFLDAQTTLFIPPSAPMQAPNLGRALQDLTVADLGQDGPAPSGRIGADQIARLAATLPIEARAAEPRTSLQVLALDEVPQATFGPLWSGREILLATLQPAADLVSDRIPNTVLPAQQPPSTAPMRMALLPDINPLDWLGATAGAAARGAKDLLYPDPAADLASWMAAHRAQAMLYQLDRETPDQIHLVLADAADAQTVFAALGRAMSSGTPLTGQAALLDWDGSWASWTDRSRLPTLTGDITWGNFRAVVGNYASARPLYFVLTLLALTLLSALVARGIILTSRPRQ